MGGHFAQVLVAYLHFSFAPLVSTRYLFAQEPLLTFNSRKKCVQNQYEMFVKEQDTEEKQAKRIRVDNEEH